MRHAWRRFPEQEGPVRAKPTQRGHTRRASATRPVPLRQPQRALSRPRPKHFPAAARRPAARPEYPGPAARRRATSRAGRPARTPRSTGRPPPCRPETTRPCSATPTPLCLPATTLSYRDRPISPPGAPARSRASNGSLAPSRDVRTRKPRKPEARPPAGFPRRNREPAIRNPLC